MDLREVSSQATKKCQNSKKSALVLFRAKNSRKLGSNSIELFQFFLTFILLDPDDEEVIKQETPHLGSQNGWKIQ